MSDIETRPIWDPERKEWTRWADMSPEDVERLGDKNEPNEQAERPGETERLDNEALGMAAKTYDAVVDTLREMEEQDRLNASFGISGPLGEIADARALYLKTLKDAKRKLRKIVNSGTAEKGALRSLNEALQKLESSRPYSALELVHEQLEEIAEAPGADHEGLWDKVNSGLESAHKEVESAIINDKRRRWQKLNVEDEIIEKIISQLSDSQRYLAADGTIDVRSFNSKQFELYKKIWAKATEELRDDKGDVDARFLNPKDRKAFDALQERDQERPETRGASLARHEEAQRAILGIGRQRRVDARHRMVRDLSDEVEVIWAGDARDQVVAAQVLAGDGVKAVSFERPTRVETRRPRRLSGWDLTVIAWRNFVTAILSLLLIAPLAVIASGRSEDFGSVFIAMVVLMILLPGAYAPWYTVLGFVPAWILYGLVASFVYGDRDAGTGFLIFWIWLFCLYPFVKGIWHQRTWIAERKAGKPRHRTTNHPWGLAATAVGLMAAAHYLFRGNKQMQ